MTYSIYAFFSTYFLIRCPLTVRRRAFSPSSATVCSFYDSTRALGRGDLSQGYVEGSSAKRY
jgi:hypothetical protein